MPEYTYRREDGTIFTIKQKFTDSALTTDPTTGQKIWRVIQNAGVIFKGSGFYVNDSKGAKSALTNGTPSNATTDKSASSGGDIPKSDMPSTTAPATSSIKAAE